jgi:hypothetical protein
MVFPVSAAHAKAFAFGFLISFALIFPIGASMLSGSLSVAHADAPTGSSPYGGGGEDGGSC